MAARSAEIALRRDKTACRTSPAACTPPAIIAALNRALQEALANADVKQRLLALGVDSRANTPAEMDARLRGDAQKWAQVIARAGIERH